MGHEVSERVEKRFRGSAKEEQKNKKVHVGKIFEICVEKGSELPEGDPLRKFKGRTVFQGNNVKDENNDTALFSELGSSPATMEAGKTLDAYRHILRLRPGSKVLKLKPGFACSGSAGLKVGKANLRIRLLS